MNLQKINKKLAARFGGAVRAKLADGCIVLSGHVKTWQEVVVAGQTAAEKYSTVHVVNDLTCDKVKEQPMRMPKLRDKALEGRTPDVLIIGGGISGVTIARELTRWKLDVLLVEKEADLALQASGATTAKSTPGLTFPKARKSTIT